VKLTRMISPKQNINGRKDLKFGKYTANKPKYPNKNW
jgi:hypothetical protein